MIFCVGNQTTRTYALFGRLVMFGTSIAEVVDLPDFPSNDPDPLLHLLSRAFALDLESFPLESGRVALRDSALLPAEGPFSKLGSDRVPSAFSATHLLKAA